MESYASYCPFKNSECDKNCALRFSYPDKPIPLCSFQAIAIMLYNIDDRLANIQKALQQNC